jgi:hypothetical protein
MDLVNCTEMAAGWSMGVDKDAREHVVVVVKGTFRIPSIPDRTAHLAAEQAPLLLADTFTGAPGFSAPVHEADFALRKSKCDVLLEATGYAPHAQPAERVRIGVWIGNWSKFINVVGDRVWVEHGATLGPSRPMPFITMPISYDRAFGGIDSTDPDRVDAFLANPVGRGHGAVRSGQHLAGRALPNTEAPGIPVMLPWGGYRPVGLGPIGRGWQPRIDYAGTYDQEWIDNTFPFLPPDFDDRYFQAAPDDQQIDFPRGNEEVTLLNLTPDARVSFRLPEIEMPVIFVPRRGDRVEIRGMLDTIVIAPDRNVVFLTWRASRPLMNDIFELAEIVVGSRSRTWWRARETGKRYYPSLGALARASREIGG